MVSCQYSYYFISCILESPLSLVFLIVTSCLIFSSPTGEQFLTCKEVSSFLYSFSDHNNARQPDGGHGRENVLVGCIVATENVSYILVQLFGLLYLR